MSFEISIPQEISDLNRGLRLLNDTIMAHANSSEYDSKSYQDIAEHLLKMDEERRTRIEQLKQCERKWNKVKWLTGVFSINVVLFSFFATEFGLFISPDSQGQWIANVSIASAAAVTAMAAAILSGISYLIERKYKSIKRKLKMNEEDISALKKFREIITSLGALQHAKEDKDAPVIVDEEVTKCLANVKKLPKKIGEQKMPSRERLVSLVTNILPENHTLKRELKEIKELEKQERRGRTELLELDNESNGVEIESTEETPENIDALQHYGLSRPFEDIGQKSQRTMQAMSNPLFHRQPSSESNPSPRIQKAWDLFTKDLGFYIPAIYCTDGKCTEVTCFQNPFPANSYHSTL